MRAPLEKPSIAKTIVAWVVEGRGDAEIAGMLTEFGIPITRGAVRYFRKRHDTDVAALARRAVQPLEDVAIAKKQERLRTLQELHDRSMAVVRERGIMAEDAKWIGGEDYGREITVRRYDARWRGRSSRSSARRRRRRATATRSGRRIPRRSRSYP